MAKLLIVTTVTGMHPTDAVVNAGRYQPGHVVSIIEDTDHWGALDIGPHSAEVSFPGLAKSDLEFLLTPDMTQTPTVIGADTFLVQTLKSVRMWKASDIAALKLASGTVVPKAQVVTFANTYFGKN